MRGFQNLLVVWPACLLCLILRDVECFVLKGGAGSVSSSSSKSNAGRPRTVWDGWAGTSVSGSGGLREGDRKTFTALNQWDFPGLFDLDDRPPYPDFQDFAYWGSLIICFASMAIWSFSDQKCLEREKERLENMAALGLNNSPGDRMLYRQMKDAAMAAKMNEYLGLEIQRANQADDFEKRRERRRKMRQQEEEASKVESSS
uniref:Uncharacterized protein n=1 Tax=Chromera velia CCMP2878 TaxID=1169474 RepID=A0A0G4I193_9ALVE|eukprot:Cvel_10100.t1-p1 / transcript=Cvel_10100.t1 / gene=Cvel_10100 / organism=Chromera_velia_CCMP2878 / gene_product=hypothetical protein / transcript_product=hypothetical protein / location=Cvel_scaffold601:77052-77654(+) / protein_length=201 / sequence_SO=supercontig / SO=protein_coding / is_pseudo=false